MIEGLKEAADEVAVLVDMKESFGNAEIEATPVKDAE